jgi:high-affinity Fe2+/Pb2+ permease
VLDAVIVFVREGAELLLIVEAMRLALRGGSRPALAALVTPGALAGIACAACLSLWAEARGQDTTLTLVLGSVFLVGIVGLACGMLSSAVSLRAEVRSRLARAAESPAGPALVVVFAIVAAMRETLEVAAMLDATARDEGGHVALMGGLYGAAATLLMTVAYRRLNERLDFLAPFRLSSLLVSIISIRVLIARFGDLLHAGLGADSRWWQLSRPFLPGGAWHSWLWAALVAIPGILLARSWWTESRR